ncbi:hypothetical protein SAMN05216338_104569 [Bradyrhizobium sp. Rc2d]|nr:hypothetical protein SAMN05216338_104569 [Bradyrhizobium sp. Rc2d]
MTINLAEEAVAAWPRSALFAIASKAGCTSDGGTGDDLKTLSGGVLATPCGA